MDDIHNMTKDELLVFLTDCLLWRASVTGEIKFGTNDGSIEEFEDDLIKELSSVIKDKGAKNIAAFIGEPIQASGGVIVPPKNYLKRVRDICKKNNLF